MLMKPSVNESVNLDGASIHFLAIDNGNLYYI